MNKTYILAALAAGTALAAVPAKAQERDPANDFNGLYVAGVVGIPAQGNDDSERTVFDIDGDGSFDDTVATTAGANAFSPGFCGGAALGNAPGLGCAKDDDNLEYFGRIGYDRRLGNFVVGGLVEGGRSEAIDSVTSFSTTPASYTLTRQADFNINARLRAGYTPGGGVLFYATGGGAYAKMDNSFSTTNGTNAFTNTGKSDLWGYSAGGGVEAYVAGGLTVGLEYLYTNYVEEGDEFTVLVTQGRATATNPFLLGSAGQTEIRRDDDFDTHAIRLVLGYRF